MLLKYVKRKLYKSGVTFVLSIPRPIIRVLEADGGLEDLTFDLEFDPDQIVFKIRRGNNDIN